MKKLLLITALLLCNILSAQKKDNFEPKTQADSLGYYMGVLQGSGMKSPYADQIKEINYDLFKKSFEYYLKNGVSEEIAENANLYLNTYFRDLIAKADKHNKAEGEEFLKQNRTKPGVTETASGLQYKVINKGKGKKVSKDATVVIGYELKYLDGTVIDASERNTLRMDEIIEGIQEGLQLMSEGAEYEFYIPYQLAYGESVPDENGIAYSTLIETIKLIEIYEDHEIEEKEFPLALEIIEVGDTDAGDYTRDIPKSPTHFVTFENDDERVVKTILFKDRYYTFTDKRLIVHDKDKKELKRIDYQQQSDDWTHYHLSAAVYTPKNGNLPFFLVVEGSTPQGVHTGIDFYTIDTNNNAEYAGYADVSTERDTYMYDDYTILPLLKFKENKTGINIYFDAKKVYYQWSASVEVLPQDLWLTYSAGKISMQGPATNLSVFKQKVLENRLSSENEISFITFGDINGDMQIDVLYQKKDDDKLYIALCNDYNIIKTLNFKLSFEYSISDVEGHRQLSNNVITVFNADDYEYVEFVLKNDKLEYNNQSQGLKKQIENQITKGNSSVLSFITFGDINNDGETDALYTRTDDKKLYISLCKAGTVTKTIPITLGFAYTINGVENVLKNGVITIYNDVDYEYNRFILKNNTLELKNEE